MPPGEPRHPTRPRRSNIAWRPLGAYDGGRLVGFVKLAWDGGDHAFVLDTTVHPQYQRRGIGRLLVRRATEIAEENGVEWLHVDHEPHLEGFYARCGFRPDPGRLDPARQLLKNRTTTLLGC